MSLSHRSEICFIRESSPEGFEESRHDDLREREGSPTVRKDHRFHR